MILSEPEKPPHCPWCHNSGSAILAHAAVRWGYRIEANIVPDDNAWEAHWYCAGCEAAFPPGVGSTIEEALTRSARRGSALLAERRGDIDKEIKDEAQRVLCLLDKIAEANERNKHIAPVSVLGLRRALRHMVSEGYDPEKVVIEVTHQEGEKPSPNAFVTGPHVKWRCWRSKEDQEEALALTRKTQ